MRAAIGHWTRRAFVCAPAIAVAAEHAGKGQSLATDRRRYLDPATEFEVVRLTDPAHTSYLAPAYAHGASRKGNFLVYSSDRGGSWQLFRMDLKSGVPRQLTGATALDPHNFTMLSDEHSVCYFDERRLLLAPFSSLRERVVYEIPEGWERADGFSVAADSLFAFLIEKKTDSNVHRLRMIPVMKGAAATLAEKDGPITSPAARPRRASVLYAYDDGAWLVHYDGQQNRRLKTAPGVVTSPTWSPHGHNVIYINFPAEKGQLNGLREVVADTGADRLIAPTSQFVRFGCNGDATVFIGASGSKASPHVLLLLRAARKELTVCEHKASDPSMAAPQFAPSSQRIFFQTDRDGKPAIYTMALEKWVEKTDESPRGETGEA